MLIKKHTAGNAIVTESKLLKDRITGEVREVDICIEINHPASERPLTVSVECTDSKRKCDVPWVEQMKSKHERLPTDALILVSRHGFTSNAYGLAQKYGIGIYALEQVNSAKKIQALDFDTLFLKYFELSPTNVSIRFLGIEGFPAEDISVLPNNVIFSRDRKELGTVKEFVDTFLNHLQVKRELSGHGDTPHKGFELIVEGPMWKYETPLYMRKETSALFRQINHVKIQGNCNFITSSLALEHGSLGKTKVAWGEAAVGEQTALFVATETEAGEKKVSLVMSGSEFRQEPHPATDKREEPPEK